MFWLLHFHASACPMSNICSSLPSNAVCCHLVPGCWPSCWWHGCHSTPGTGRAALGHPCLPFNHTSSPGLEPACGHGGGEHPRGALRLREGGEANTSRAPPEQGQEKHSSTRRTASPSPAQDTSAGRWAKRAERGGSSWLALAVPLWLILSTAWRGILQPPRLRAGKGDIHPPLLGAGLRGVAA